MHMAAIAPLCAFLTGGVCAASSEARRPPQASGAGSQATREMSIQHATVCTRVPVQAASALLAAKAGGRLGGWGF